jgi:putative transcriptional regulator
MTKTAEPKTKINWSRADAMTEAERHAAAMADPDIRPMTDEEWARALRVPQVSIIRRALRLSQEQFAATFHIPVGTDPGLGARPLRARCGGARLSARDRARA